MEIEIRKTLGHLIDTYKNNYFQQNKTQFKEICVFSKFEKKIAFDWWWNVDLKIDGLKKGLPKQLIYDWEENHIKRISTGEEVFIGETFEDFIIMNSILEQIFEYFEINYN